MLFFLQTEIPEHLHADKAFQAIYGIGKSSAKVSCKIFGLMSDIRGKDLRKKHRLDLKNNFEDFDRPLGINLKQIYIANCKRLIDIRSYRGNRHKLGYPVRGQRTHTNANNQKRLHKRWILQEISTNIQVKTKKSSKNITKKKGKAKPKQKKK